MITGAQKHGSHARSNATRHLKSQHAEKKGLPKTWIPTSHAFSGTSDLEKWAERGRIVHSQTLTAFLNEQGR